MRGCSKAIPLCPRISTVLVATSALGLHVVHVVLVGTQKQVARVAALRIVTLVADEQPVGRSFERPVRGDVGIAELTFLLETAVAAVVHGPLPFPATGVRPPHSLEQEALKRRDLICHQQIEQGVFLRPLIQLGEVY